MQWFLIILSIVIAAAVGWWMYRVDKKRDTPMPWLTASLRGLLVLLVLMLIVAPDIHTTKNETKEPIILFLQDKSISIAHALKDDSTAYRNSIETLQEKLNKEHQVVSWSFGDAVQRDSIYNYTDETTNIAQALSEAQEYYGGQNLGAVILATDGRFNQGTNPAYQNLALKANLYTIGLGDSTVQKDIKIANTYYNRTATLNNDFEIRADIIATKCNGYTGNITLSEDNQVLARKAISIQGDKYDRAVSFTIRADQPGIHHYQLQLPTFDGEQNVTNNKRDIFVDVLDSKKNILIAAVAPHPDVAAIKLALEGLDNYNISVETGINLDVDVNEYDIFILHQMPYANDYFFKSVVKSKKPIWYILGDRTNPSVLAQGPKPVAINARQGFLRNVMATHNSGFNLFTLPKNIKEVMAELPPISIINGSMSLLPNSEMLFYDQRTNVPIWTLQQNTTPTAMLSGVGLWRWRMYEYKNFGTHNTIDECIKQTVAFLATNSNRKQFDVKLPKHIWSNRQAISMNAYLLNANSEQVNTSDVTMTIIDSAGNKKDFSFERSGSSYKLNIGIWAEGRYTYEATTKYNNKDLTATGSFIVESQPVELLETSADFAGLYNLSQKYNGAFFTTATMSSIYDSIQNNESIKPVITTEVTTIPLIDRKWIFFLILIIALVEWLLRKYWLAQ